MERLFVSIVMPTFNSARTLEAALAAIKNQNYPADKVEIIIADAGSTDKTRQIANKYTNLIFDNPLTTGEAGKAVAVKKAKGDIVALIDSDNILPTNDWLEKMVAPFDDPEIIGSEPLEYTYRPTDHYITRYCALIGMNDPLCYFLGNYDRYSFLSKKWNGLQIKVEEQDDYLKVFLEPGKMPTIGANGTMIRKQYLQNVGDYLMDIDIIYDLVASGKNKFAKVKVGIIHLFGGSLKTFYRKQKRRVKDYLYFKDKGNRSYPWKSQSRVGLVKFVVYCLLIFPLIFQSIIGFCRRRDWVWFLHPVFCWITFWVYGWGTIFSLWHKEQMSREKYGQ
ncbi:MAG: glycosyltransferase [Patescibacteria group bacterium]|jgi:glycosyltransferase involved in cell wall biosynthesis